MPPSSTLSRAISKPVTELSYKRALDVTVRRSTHDSTNGVVQRVLVTGANGFIGKSVCAILSDAGFIVRASVRDEASATEVRAANEVVFVGEVGVGARWEKAVDGMDAVVHLVGRAHVLRESSSDPLAEFRKVNVRGSENLARAAAEAGVRRLVYVSSIGVNGRFTGDRAFTENDPPAPHNFYTKSKWEAEQVLKTISEQSGIELVLLRSPLVYGPYVKANFLRLMKLADSGMPLPLGSVRNRRSLIFVDNLSHAVSACLTHPAAAGEMFLLSDGEDVSTPELVRRIARHLGRPARLVPFPPSVLKMGARLVGKESIADSLLSSLVVDSSKIRRALGWTPPHGLDEGIKKSTRWFKEV